jgi:hypothetical protein
VSWYRAEREMYTWLENFEIKHAEFRRLIRRLMHEVTQWTTLAEKNKGPGHRAYAYRQVSMYRRMLLEEQFRFKHCGMSDWTDLDNGKSFWELVDTFRHNELSWLYSAVRFKLMVITSSLLKCCLTRQMESHCLLSIIPGTERYSTAFTRSIMI